MRKTGIIVAVLVVVGILGAGLVNRLTSPQRHYVELLDEALYNAGYVAGMVKGRHPIWPMVRLYVGRDGIWGSVLLELPRPGLSDDVAAEANLTRYKEGHEAGSGQEFNEPDMSARSLRLHDIIENELVPAGRAAMD